jgi:hypothetical protein
MQKHMVLRVSKCRYPCLDPPTYLGGFLTPAVTVGTFDLKAHKLRTPYETLLIQYSP